MNALPAINQHPNRVYKLKNSYYRRTRRDCSSAVMAQVGPRRTLGFRGRRTYSEAALRHGRDKYIRGRGSIYALESKPNFILHSYYTKSADNPIPLQSVGRV